MKFKGKCVFTRTIAIIAVLSIILPLLPLTASADTTLTIPSQATRPSQGGEQDIFLTEFTESGATIIQYNGYGGRVSIPNTIDGYPVTAIAEYAFAYQSEITHITIPEGVVQIGDYAFEACTGLRYIEIPDSVESIGLCAFIGCNELVGIILPKNLKVINDLTFFGCSNLLSINIPDGVTTIGLSAFAMNDNLLRVNIPDSVTYIEQGVFDSSDNVTIYGNDGSYAQSFFSESWINFETLKDPEDEFAYRYVNGACEIFLYSGDKDKKDVISIPKDFSDIPVTRIAEYAFYELSNITAMIPNSVTYIASSAFKDCNSMQVIIIPSNVKYIGVNAFENLSSMSNVYVDAANEYYCDENGVLFNKDKTVLYYFPPNRMEVSYTIPDSVIGIADYAFYNNAALEEIIIPDSVEIIGSHAFDKMVNLKQINMPSNLKSIGDYAFAYCAKLTDITIPAGVLGIGSHAFYGCAALTEIVIPNSVTSIGNRAFTGCAALTEIVIPYSVASIGSKAFFECSALETITISNSVTTIGEDAFTSTLWYKNQPDGIVYIGKIAYKYKGKVTDTELTIKEGTIGIADYAFYGCDTVTSVIIPESVKNIGAHAFQNCLSITAIIIDGNDVNVNQYAFSNCTSLKDIEITGSLKSIGANAFSETLWYGSQQDGIVYIADFVYNYKGEITNKDVVIEEGTVGIAGAAFYNADITSINIPQTVKVIGEQAFSGCSSLTKITLPTGITSIGESTFYHCYRLKEIIIPSSVISIEANAFKDCTALEEIVIPNNVTSINSGAFSNCVSLTSVIVPNSVTFISGNSFIGCPNATIYYFLNDYVETYAVVYQLQSNILQTPVEYFEYEVIDDDKIEITKYIGNDTSVYIPNTINGLTVTSIGDSAFSDCFDLKSIEITTNVVNIGNEAFRACYSITSINIPDSVINIGNLAFSGCSGLTSLNIPNSVVSIGDEAFAGCSNLIRIQLSNSITRIGYMTFSWCDKLESINIPNGVKSIEEAAFSNCFALTGLVIPISVTSIADNVFDYEYGDFVIYGYPGSYAIQYAKDNNIMYEEIISTLTDFTFEPGEGGFIITKYTGEDSSVSIPNEIDEIPVIGVGKEAFANNDVITNIVMPDSIKNIGEMAFWGCTGLEGIKIPDSVVTIGIAAFGGCSGFTSIEIPRSVTHIYDKAFYECINLEKVEISISVLHIGEMAFGACSSLADIIIPINVTSIGKDAFINCGKNFVIYGYPGSYSEEYAEKNSITFNIIVNPLDDFDFDYENGGYIVTKYYGTDSFVSIPEDIDGMPIIGIGEGAFLDNSYIVSVIMPNSIQNIHQQAFFSCTALKEIAISENVKNIGVGAFYMCSSLKSITIPDGVITIGDAAFYMCDSLESIDIPKSVTSIGIGAFASNSKLSDISVSSDNMNYYSENGVLYSNDKSLLICYPSGMPGASFAIPNVVKNINALAFTATQNLKYVEIPNSITAIDYCAFYECLSLVNIKLSNNVEIIDDNAFYMCSSLESINIPNQVKKIGESAFYMCSSLKSLDIPESTTSIGANAFTDTPWLAAAEQEVMDNGEYVVYAGKVAYKYVDSMPEGTELMLKYDTTGIADNAFSNCTNASVIALPANISSIGINAFADCSEDLTFYVTNNSYAFNYVVENKLKYYGLDYDVSNEQAYITRTINFTGSEIVIPEMIGNAYVISIGEGAFADLSALAKITIPRSVKSIGENAFSNCADEFVICGYYGSYANEYAEENSIPFVGIELTGQKFNCISTKDGIVLTKYIGRDLDVIIPSAINDIPVIGIDGDTFNSAQNITSVLISDIITSIDDSLFADCTSLTEISVDSNNKNYSGENGVLFNKDKSVLLYYPFAKTNTSYTIPNTVTTINQSAFYKSSALESIVIPDSVTSIGENAFEGTAWFADELKKLDDVTDPSKLIIYAGKFVYSYKFIDDMQNVEITLRDDTVGIADSALANFKNLKKIIMPESLKYIGNTAFTGCSGLTNVTIPKSVTRIANDAFTNCSEYFVIYGIPDSYAAEYAEDNSILFIEIEFTAGNFLCKSNENGVVIMGYNGNDSVISVPAIINDMTVYAIGDNAFANNQNVTNIIIPVGVVTIGDNVFVGCVNLVSISVNPGNKNFSVAGGVLFNYSKSVLIHYPTAKTNTAYSIPDTVTTIYPLAFYKCNTLKSIDISDRVISIGEGAFAGCSDALIIYGYLDSCAEEYAKANGIVFEAVIDDREPIYGDTNNDGTINNADVTALKRYLACWSVPGFRVQNADVNKDSEVNDIDVVILKRFQAGWDVIF